MCTCQDCAGARHTTDTTCHWARHAEGTVQVLLGVYHAEGTVQVLLGVYMLRESSRSCSDFHMASCARH